jgi:hypothetical protein
MFTRLIFVFVLTEPGHHKTSTGARRLAELAPEQESKTHGLARCAPRGPHHASGEAG